MNDLLQQLGDYISIFTGDVRSAEASVHQSAAEVEACAETVPGDWTNYSNSRFQSGAHYNKVGTAFRNGQGGIAMGPGGMVIGNGHGSVAMGPGGMVICNGKSGIVMGPGGMVIGNGHGGVAMGQDGLVISNGQGGTIVNHGKISFLKGDMDCSTGKTHQFYLDNISVQISGHHSVSFNGREMLVNGRRIDFSGYGSYVDVVVESGVFYVNGEKLD